MRLFVADPHGLIRAGIKRALEGEAGFDVVGEAESSTQLLSRLERERPDLVLVDMHLPGIGVELVLDRIRATHPGVHVIVLAGQASPDAMHQVCARGARGVILKTIAPGDLAAAIRQIVGGTTFTALGAPTYRLDPGESAGLTGREQEFLVAIAKGHSNKAIAKELYVTEQTVKFHLTNIYRKLGLTNRTAAARWAYHHGLISTSQAA